ncbi:MAG: N-6 DNA methylase [Desulfitobacterium hafniense]|nr:N-6 DNA methylase [Desulfitobacterium hafniense]
MTKTNDQIMSVFDFAYRELRKWDMRSASNDNPVAALTFFIFLKYVTDNKAGLKLKFEEKYNFDYLVLLFGEKIEHAELVSHVSSIEQQLGFNYGILESFADSLDLKKFNRQTTEILHAINSLDLKAEEGNHLAYHSLVSYISMQSKKELRFAGEFISDVNLSRLMAEIADIENGMSLYDFAAGYGISLSEAAKDKDVVVAAQDITKVCAAVSIMSLTMCGNSGAEVRCDDSISNPLTMGREQNLTFDRVISAPPFGLRRSNEDALIHSGQQANAFEYGLAYKLTGDLVFSRHLLASLNENGIGVLQMPMGSLFRSGMEEKIRTQMIEDNYIDAVIELPSGIVAGTNIKTALVVFKKNRANKDVFILDLARDGAKDYVERTSRTGTSITEAGIVAIKKLIIERQEVEGLSRLVDKAEIIENGSNLCPGVYLQQSISDTLEVRDLTPLLKKNEVLQNKLLHLNKRFIQVLAKIQG